MKKSFAVLLSSLVTTSSLSAMEENFLQTHNIPRKSTLEEQLSVERLLTNDDHTNFLKSALDTAVKDVMISSYNISAKKFIEEGIDKSIKNAAKRGVDIYIYYNKSSQKEYTELSKIAQYCVKFEEIDNHSKCVIKDRTIHGKRAVAIGSYNWLAESVKDSSNASMVLSGMFVQGLGADIWDGIKFYRSLREENKKGVNKFLGNLGAFTTGEYKFEEGEYYYTLSTPEAHQTLFNEVIEKAKKRVLLFSPFVRLEKLQNIFTHSLLENLQKRKVNIKLTTLPNPCNSPQEQKEIFSYLDALSDTFSNFSYLKCPNFHAKTLLADEDFICEGSRNCLSSVDDLEHNANNFEMSIAVRGKNAKKLIDEFEKTDIAKFVLSKEPIKVVDPKVIEKKCNFSFEMGNSFTMGRDPKKIKTQNLNPSTWQNTSNNSQWKSNSNPSWQNNFKPSSKKKSSKASSRQANFEIFSGLKFGKNGYCVRFDKRDYIIDDNAEIVYFSTYQEAQQAGFKFK